MEAVDEQSGAEQAPPAFEKMRSMLARASDLRAEEQRQMVELIDEIRSRLQPIEGFVADGKGRLVKTEDGVSAIRDHLATLPDRGEVSVIAERVDEALSRIDAQDETLRQITSVLAGLADRVGRPLEAIEARLDGVAGRFEGISGRLDGVDDRMQHLHARLDELDGVITRAQAAIEALPGTLDIPAVHGRFDELSGALQQRLDEDITRLHTRFDEVLARPAVDPSERLDGLGARLDQLGERVEDVGGRVRGVDETVRHNGGSLHGALEQGVDKLRGALEERPDRGELERSLRAAQQESERRVVQQLDAVLAAFAEIVISRPKEAPPRSTNSRQRKKAAADAAEEPAEE